MVNELYRGRLVTVRMLQPLFQLNDLKNENEKIRSQTEKFLNQDSESCEEYNILGQKLGKYSRSRDVDAGL